MKICIDAGHGGHDPGACGPGGLHESAVVLEICHSLADLLEQNQISTFLTREEEIFIGLAKRCEIANSGQADYFISIHCNSNGPDVAVGIETLYKTQQGKFLAVPVQSALIEATGDRDRGLKHRTDLHVLNATAMPAILAEVGFISHPATEAKLRTADYQLLLAKAIANGLISFLDEK